MTKEELSTLNKNLWICIGALDEAIKHDFNTWELLAVRRRLRELTQEISDRVDFDE